MKIAKMVIENFRHIERLELDFTDSLGRVRDVSVIVGPNTSGKTTILDAIAAGVGLATELRPVPLRSGFVLGSRALVRRGAVRARVTSTIHFSQDEIDAVRRLFSLAEEPEGQVQDDRVVQVTWDFPSSQYKGSRFHIQCDPSHGCNLLKGRATAARLLSTERVGLEWFSRVGGVFVFDQQRTGMGKVIQRDIWKIIQYSIPEESIQDWPDRRYTTDPRTILLALAVKSAFPSAQDTRSDQFSLIKSRYDQVCKPHQLVGAVRNAQDELDLCFRQGEYEYKYDGLSSGEQMMLLFLIKMVTEHINRSIVLIDEIELHQHPLWQRKLLNLLPKMGIDNQFIVTTHSAYLRDNVPGDAIIDLGDLGDRRGRR